MLRGHLSSIELFRGFFIPLFKRNLTVVSIKYAEEKDARKADGMFSWLKDFLKPDYRIDEIGSLPEYLRVKQTVINFKLEDADDQEVNAIEESYKNSELRENSSTEVVGYQTDIEENNTTTDSKPDRETLKDEDSDSISTRMLMENSVTDDTNPKRDRQSPLARHGLLTLTDLLNRPVRTIVSCAPRSTKPPIREPNMPEKRDKKDEKKDKKKKKPVIRMEGGVSGNCGNEATPDATCNLHDNMDVNFQWGTSLAEEVDTSRQLEPKQNLNNRLHQMENVNSFVGDSNYSSDQVSSTYDVNAIHTMRNLQLTMNSAKDTDKKNEAAVELSSGKSDKSSETNVSNELPKEAAGIESVKKILKMSPIVMKETNVDEDYNIPSNANFDVEINAWKDLVLKSKVPLDPSREDFIDSENPRRTETLSIRPEPPEPKLDVQAIPTTSDETTAEEEDPEYAKEMKPNMNAKKVSSPTDVQKLDIKKLHTETFCFSKRYNNGGINGKLKFHRPLSVLDSLDNDVNLGTLNFSTNTEGGWRSFEQRVSEESRRVNREQTEGGEQSNVMKSQSTEENVTNVENTSWNENNTAQEQQQERGNFEPQEQSDPGTNFTNNLNTMGEKEIDVSFSRSQAENQVARENSVFTSSRRDSRKYETDEYINAQADNYQSNLDYSNSYGDDYYPGYESMSLEPATERQSSGRNEESARDEQQQTDDNKELFVKSSEQMENTSQYVTDNNYIKVPGDPYPYSREHFNKWRMCEQLHIGPQKTTETEEILNPPINSNTGTRIDTQQPVRKLSQDSRVRGKWYKNVHS
ncbi:uncharacterized protein LOC117213448 [Bombus bifarius]|uniref:Uncharacterized protein LOC117213448 n=1 Tax=Bombus bifarius TaxID=103933 RepID=A0A6P8N1V0_9HYME|nr:uncharacterized protein LOC117213448 [Bombus bifarius]